MVLGVMRTRSVNAANRNLLWEAGPAD